MTADEVYAILNKKIKNLQPSTGDQPIYDGEKYSYQEREVGTWVNGKPLYEKTVNFGSLPNSASKAISHGATNVDTIWIHGGYAYDDSGTYALSVPCESLNLPGENVSYAWRTSVTKESIIIESPDNKTSVSAVVVIRYTKTTD